MTRKPERQGLLSSLRQLADPDPIRQELREGKHAVSYVRHILRGNKIRDRRFFETVTPDHPPVLLLHGYLGTRGSMWRLEQRLAESGICVVSFNLGAVNVRDIRASAVLIQRKIESILAQTGIRKMDILGHSMGGLIGLYYVKKLGGHEKVRKLLMMGTPQRGTWAALGAVAMMGLVSPSAWQLLPKSRFLQELEEGPLPPGVDYYTIAARRDWACPYDSTHLSGATAITVPMGHLGLVMSEDVYKRILWALRR